MVVEVVVTVLIAVLSLVVVVVVALAKSWLIAVVVDGRVVGAWFSAPADTGDGYGRSPRVTRSL